MIKLYENIRYFRELLGMSQEELAKKTGYTSRSSIAKIENGDVDISQSKIEEFAKALQITPTKLLGWDSELENTKNIISIPHLKPIKYFSLLSCGKGNFQNEEPIDYLSIPSFKLNPHKEYFAHIADGDSMINAGIEDGDILVFEICNTPLDNGIGSFVIDDGVATCKRFKRINGKAYLMPANDNYVPMEVDENTRMIGLLAFVIKDYREVE